MTTEAIDEDLRWLNAALFTSGGFVAGRGGGFSPLVAAGTLRRIIPNSPRLAAASFKQTHDAMTSGRRWAGRVVQAALRARLGSLLFRRQLDLERALGLAGDPTHSLLARLGNEVRATDLAITLGPKRANRKPVVQLLANDAVVAYAKVACDEITSELVKNETMWLEKVALADHPDVLRVPKKIASFDWNGHPVLVMDAATPRAHAPQCFDHARVGELSSAVAHLAPRQMVSFEQALARADLDTAVDQSVVSRLAAEYAGASIEVAPWHGDLTPWNTISDSSGTWLLDWEFAAESMPIGADLVHHHVMVATHLEGTSPEAALTSTHHRVASAIVATGANSDADVTWAVYLCALVRREAQLTASGSDDGGLGAAAARALSALPGVQ